MEHETIESLIPAYAAGAADPAERGTVERHLPGCADCRALLAEYEGLCTALLYTVPQVAAPEALYADLAQQLGATPAGRAAAGSRPVQGRASGGARPWWAGWRWPALAFAAAALVLLVASNLFWLNRWRQVQQDLTTQATVVAMLAQHPKEIGMSPEPAVPGARGDFYFDPRGTTGVLRVAGLPAVPSDKAYQLWLVRSGQRDSGGLFRVGTDGSGMLVVAAKRPLAQYDALGITLEPASGSPGPTTPRLLGGRF